jgi:hypothetical protein
MTEKLSAEELKALVLQVFEPTNEDRGIAILVDLPDARKPDHDAWRDRREMAREWAEVLAEARHEIGVPEILLCLYPNVGANNAELPSRVALILPGDPLPEHESDIDPNLLVPLDQLFARCTIAIAPTELSATAPLKIAARTTGIRGVTMPGFSPAMLPALRLDFQAVDRQIMHLKSLLDRAEGARLELLVRGVERHDLFLDLRHRSSHASGGRRTDRGNVGNLPPGETYIVPYEGEIAGDPTRSEGVLPVQLDGEVVLYRIEANMAVDVISTGPRSDAERALIVREPAYANIAELGFGVLAQHGIEPCGEVLLDEKLGLHVAFGRSDHFGGQVGPSRFSEPGAVVHIDRVYLPQMQPDVHVLKVALVFAGDEELTLMRDGVYAVPLGE